MENRRKKIVFEVTVEVSEGTSVEVNINKIQEIFLEEKNQKKCIIEKVITEGHEKESEEDISEKETTVERTEEASNEAQEEKFDETIREKENVAEENEVFKKLPTVEAGEYAETLSVYTDKDGNRAVIPAGWTVSGTKKENIIWGKNEGLVIYKIPKENVMNINWFNKEEVKYLQKRYNQMVWIPVEKLKPNGTMDGKNFTEKFGRRMFGMDISDAPAYIDGKFYNIYNGELDDPEFELHCTSIKKYGGFWFSRYDLSKNEKTGKPYSVRYVEPWRSKCYNEAEKFATRFEGENPPTYEIISLKSGPKYLETSLNSHMIYGAEYDSVLEWLIETKTVTLDDIISNSYKWGHYSSGKINADNFVHKILKTGSREEWCVNNIYDLIGNTYKWTQERYYKVEDKIEKIFWALWPSPKLLSSAVSGIKLVTTYSNIIRGGNNYCIRGQAASRILTEEYEHTGYLESILCPSVRTVLFIK